ncbi:MAG: tetratricopeptide repeat protein [Burkholderiales bacterium]|nr:tetratricopeptide repeat protein [Burkholderiales bacterium]
MDLDLNLNQQLATAVSHHQAGHLDEAAEIYRVLLDVQPNHPDALHLLGLIENRRGHAAEAVRLIKQAIVLRPQVANFQLSLADALHAQCQYAAAEQACRKAIQLAQNNPEAHNHLGVMLKAQNRFADAEQAYRAAIALKPDYAEAWNNLGNALKQQGRPSEAEQSFRQALALTPQSADVWNNLGNALQHLYRLQEAEAAYRQALALRPAFADACYNLGVVLGETGRLSEAIDTYVHALQLDGANSAALDELIHLMLRACLWDVLPPLVDELLRRFRSGESDLNSFSLLDLPATVAEQLQCAQRNAARIQANVQMRYEHTPPTDWPARIKIGYLSYDYRQHPVAFLIGELFALHHRKEFEVFALAIGPDDHSPTRQNIKDTCDHFVDLVPLSRTEAAAKIKELGIHVLVDLTGYTTGARTEILALHPAPVQVNWLGYPGTMGAAYIEYIIADLTIIPPELACYYSEAVVRMPDCYQINDRRRPIAEHTPSRADCGLPEDAVVFCSFNHTHKITAEMFALWMQILQETPNSVLWLLESNALASDNLRLAAQAHGVDPARIIMAPKKPLPEHMARYRVADLALDTFPYNSHTTASDALWVGCPLITCMGETFASRVAASLLRAAHLPECVAHSFEEYAALVIKLATNRELLSSLRARLTLHRSTVPLFDAPTLVRNLESAYVRMLEQWMSGEPPRGFDVRAQ